MTRLSGTFRLVLVHEQTGTEAFARDGIPAETVEQVAALITEVGPVIATARGAHQAYAGLRQAFDGLAAMRAPRAAPRRARGRR